MSATPGPDVLSRVPGADTAVPLQVESLTGGLTNRSFRVTTSQGRYVVRLGTAYDSLLAIDRRAEPRRSGSRRTQASRRASSMPTSRAVS